MEEWRSTRERVPHILWVDEMRLNIINMICIDSRKVGGWRTNNNSRFINNICAQNACSHSKLQISIAIVAPGGEGSSGMSTVFAVPPPQPPPLAWGPGIGMLSVGLNE